MLQSMGPSQSYAVFIHAFYAEMMPEFWRLIQTLPGNPHLFLTTASPADAGKIIQYLVKQQWPQDQMTVRVVEQNRGRDMSALFITWRDVALGGQFDIALRLHSKKTPQVPQHVGKEFKSHLFDNLVGSRSQTTEILNMMHAQPDIGLIIPPVIHQGFGTLGHAWFNNKAPLLKQAKTLGLDVPFDDDTPVAPYGTMFWFRPDALHKLFSHKWRWQDYNPEPHHVDGGLAHVQERMIGYCAQDRGYRVVQVMGARQAARLYGRIEYKAQLYAAQYLSNSILDHQADMRMRQQAIRRGLYRMLRCAYGGVLRLLPTSRYRLRPVKTKVVSLLARRF